ncbi:MAG: AAA family ATPase [Actinobacteria bacterium]|nr:AAA family ATPase [Actinomycetota bacterium]
MADPLTEWAAQVAPLALVERKLHIADKAEAMVGILDGTLEDWLLRCEQAVERERARLVVQTPDAPAPDAPPAEDGPRRLVLLPMDQVQPAAVEWLWQDRLPRGKLSVIAGDPGLGKSYLTLRIAATISSGGPWPDAGRADAGSVLIVSAEDDYADTIRPRLDRLGADVSRITAIDGVRGDGPELLRPFSLRLDLDLLREAIRESGAVLVVIDPLNAFLGGIDSHKAAEVRAVLSPLAHLAGETRAAVLAVHHLNKGSSSNALYRASGSLDFVAAARIVHGVAADPDIEGRRVFVPVKCNIAALPAGIGFRIGEDGVQFDRLPVTVDAASAFTSRAVDHEERSERELAKEFIRGELADGPVPVRQLFQAAKDNGFTQMTMRRAGQDLGVEKRKEGYQGAWQWSLPEAPDSSKVIKDAKDAHVSDVNTFGIFGDPVITFDGAEPTVVEQAARLVVEIGAASPPLLQTRLGLYEAEACAVIDTLTAAGIVAPGNGDARSVLLDDPDEAAARIAGLSAPQAESGDASETLDA